MSKRTLISPAPERRQVRITVGLAWPSAKPSDRRFALGEPWPTILALVKEGVPVTLRKSAVRVSPLRASDEGSVLSGVTRSLQRADIAVFDVTPQRGRINANVLVEIGLAHAMGLRPILIAGKHGAHKVLPSDLRGLLVRCYAKSNPNDRQSIRALIRSRVKQAVSDNGHGETK
jgi:hypothetical protein